MSAQMEVPMNKVPLALAAMVGTAIGGQQLLKRRRSPAGSGSVKKTMISKMIGAMPENSPPRLITSILPRLVEQNEEILALLKEQNELLKQDQTERKSKGGKTKAKGKKGKAV